MSADIREGMIICISGYQRRMTPVVIILIAMDVSFGEQSVIFSSGVEIIGPNEGIWRSSLGKGLAPT